MDDRGLLDQRIQEARRRVVWILVLSQTGAASCVAMAGLLVLLLAGTRILDWPWLVFLFTGSLLFGLFRLFRRLPSPYTVAQRVDQVLGFHDALSTAYFYRRATRMVNASRSIIEAQRRRAEELARGIDTRRTVPFTRPRTFQIAALLGATALGLLILRYAVTRSLDLRPPIVSATAFDIFRSVPRQEASARRREAPQHSPELPPIPGVAFEEAEGKKAATTGSTSQDGATVYSPSGSQPQMPQPEEVTVPGIEGSEGEPSEGKPDTNATPSNTDSPPRGKQPPNSENSSLMNKLRDAMADLLAKLKIQPPPGIPRESSGEQGEKQAGRQKQNSGQGDPGEERQQADSGGADQGADQEGKDKSPNSGGKSGDRAAGEQASGQEKSGMGKEEGDKSLREAEQLAAMGKLSEIIGKRAEKMTGEVMVEVTSGGRQDLQTPYSERSATHSEAGGEVHRDEVPLIFQNYVQRYFEQVRKTPNPPPAKP